MQIDLLTFLFELVNFLVLAVVLQRLVYRPIAASIAARREEIASSRAETARKLAEVEQRAADLAARDRDLDRLRESIVAEATAAAATEKARLLLQAREDAAAERKRVEALLDTERDVALGWVREAAVDEGAKVAGRMLLELAPEAAHDALVARLMEALASDSRLQPHGSTGVTAEATFARFPPTEAVDALRSLLEARLGPVHLSVQEDTSLGAGVTLQVQDRLFDASVAGQLDLLKENARHALQVEA
ncbi:MAG: F0F1 ATP synthase subunit delta [Alphaproteobacteria bacterium]|nr:F0F1 ATP synthase subunit delta [Alphaproteobacteria bacterium]